MNKDKTATIRINKEVKEQMKSIFKTSPQKIIDEWIAKNMQFSIKIKKVSKVKKL